MKKAVIFDVAGTLIKRCRSVKNLRRGKIESEKGTLDEKSTLETINTLPNSALVVLQADTKSCLMNADENMRFYDFLKKYDVDMDISYSISKITETEIIERLKGDNTLLKEFQEVAIDLATKNQSIEICSGSAFIFDGLENKITYVIAAGGKIFPNVSFVVETLKNRGIQSFIASGDRAESLYEVGKIINIPHENIFTTANTKRKQSIVRQLKKEHYKVMMVGNGPNDVLALEEADVSVLTLEQGEYISDELKSKADHIINRITEVADIDF
ncbi:MAG: HAD family hydrolase [Methanobrevibacter sp.]|jgi:Cu+-exporting ATPase|nr:HAD family hydrolase [Candidatus Methanovirga aequatorialis]